jgi:hypothetical protein
MAACNMEVPMELTELHAHFADPPRPFGVIPFWFWNDDLDETELLRQIRAFHEKASAGSCRIRASGYHGGSAT